MVDGSGDCDSSSKFHLGSVHYLRVVLDEAHNVKNPNAGQTKAVCALRLRGRWALSGTSIQNHLGDLQSFLNFIKLDPLDDREFWQRNVNRPVMLGDARGFDRLVTVVAAVALRRTKTQKLPDGRFAIELPDKRVEMCLVDLASADRTLYDRHHAKATGLVERAAREGEYGGNFFATILEAILWLRQICCHSTLVTKEMLELLSHDVVAANLAADEAKLAKAGVKDIALEGEYAKAYLKTIYGAKWAVNDKYKSYNVDYKKLKSLMYD